MEYIIALAFLIWAITWVIEKVRNLLGISDPYAPPPPSHYYSNSSDDIRDYDINKIRSSGNFSAAEREVEYRRRGKSPSGVIDGVYNDAYRGNDSYNDSYRDWDADA
jgi:hypothetical protein